MATVVLVDEMRPTAPNAENVAMNTIEYDVVGCRRYDDKWTFLSENPFIMLPCDFFIVLIQSKALNQIKRLHWPITKLKHFLYGEILS